MHIIIGCMFSGKTSYIFDLINKLNNEYIIVNSILDNRYSNNKICTHTQNIHDCISIHSLSECYNELLKYNTIIIDEAQFIKDLHKYCNLLINKRKNIYVCGLNGDINQNNMGEIYKLFPLADTITLLKAQCNICKQMNAIYTHKIVDSTTLIDIGSSNKYIPLCRECYNTKNINYKL